MQKSILITGASSGIGRALALLFNKNGWKVFATGRSSVSDEVVEVEEVGSSPSATDEDRSGTSDVVLVSDVGAPLRATHSVGVDVADRQCQTLGAPVNQSPQMPRLEFSTIRDIGAAVACSWDLALLLQPYLALVVELNGGSVSTFTP